MGRRKTDSTGFRLLVLKKTKKRSHEAHEEVTKGAKKKVDDDRLDGESFGKYLMDLMSP